jgi:hypothetical protein
LRVIAGAVYREARRRGRARPPPGRKELEIWPRRVAGEAPVHTHTLKRLVIKVSVALARSLGSAILAYREGCQKGAGREGV